MSIRIEFWSVITTNANPYAAPELISPRLQGRVYGHPRIKDGEYVSTSTIIGVKNGLVLTRSGSEYQLGEVDPDYESAFPNAKERLLTDIIDGKEKPWATSS